MRKENSIDVDFMSIMGFTEISPLLKRIFRSERRELNSSSENANLKENFLVYVAANNKQLDCELSESKRKRGEKFSERTQGSRKLCEQLSWSVQLVVRGKA